jgi:hypothetical protein
MSATDKTYSYSERLVTRLIKITVGKIPLEDYMRLWKWIDTNWEKAKSEPEKLEVIMKAINSASERFPHLNILEEAKKVTVGD